MTAIEWTHRPDTKPEVLNPVTGCDKISPGCKFCYAEVMHKRLCGMGQAKYQQPFLGHVKFWPYELGKPFKWKEPRTIFINSMADVFHESVSVTAIAWIYAMAFLTSKHTHIILTKRAERACLVLTSDEFFAKYVNAVNRLHHRYINRLSEPLYSKDELRSMWPLRNVEQGVSIENQQYADERLPWLYKTPAVTRIVSCEPLLGPIDLKLQSHAIDWVICGGESGHKARPMHPDWARSLRDQCKVAGIPFFFKQWGTWNPDDFDTTTAKVMHDNSLMYKQNKKTSGNVLDGKRHLEFPNINTSLV